MVQSRQIYYFRQIIAGFQCSQLTLLSFRNPYSTALFVCKKWLSREVRHISPLRSTVLDETPKCTQIVDSFITNNLINK